MLKFITHVESKIVCLSPTAYFLFILLFLNSCVRKLIKIFSFKEDK